MSSEAVTAGRVMELLEEKHSKDVFVSECKDGPSQLGRGHLRMDAWVMARSWANPCVSAYEVKVSRADFLGDDKWQGYLDYCNRFSFVCPRGVVLPEELPAEVGLLWVAKTGTRLFTKRKAAFRDVAIPEDLYRYILMCRATIRKSEFSVEARYKRETDRDYWRRWLQNREVDYDLGQRVGGALREKIKSEVIDVRAENELLRHKINAFEAVKKHLEAMGLDPDNPPPEWAAERRLRQAMEVVSRVDIRQVRRTGEALSEIADKLDAINNGEESADKAA